MIVNKPSDNVDWYVLRGFNKWNKNRDIDEQGILEDLWFRINACIIRNKDFDNLEKSVKGKQLISPRLIYVFENGGQGYYGEYPWYSPYSELQDWWNPADSISNVINVEYISPVAEYKWSDSNDFSLNDPVGVYLPAKILTKSLKLERDKRKFDVWNDSDGKTAYQDPCVFNRGRSYGLIRKDLLDSWLNKNDYRIVWLIGGEKNLLSHNSNNYYGRLIYSGLYTIDKEMVNGEMWYEKDK